MEQKKQVMYKKILFSLFFLSSSVSALCPQQPLGAESSLGLNFSDYTPKNCSKLPVSRLGCRCAKKNLSKFNIDAKNINLDSEQQKMLQQALLSKAKMGLLSLSNNITALASDFELGNSPIKACNLQVLQSPCPGNEVANKQAKDILNSFQAEMSQRFGNKTSHSPLINRKKFKNTCNKDITDSVTSNILNITSAGVAKNLLATLNALPEVNEDIQTFSDAIKTLPVSKRTSIRYLTNSNPKLVKLLTSESYFAQWKNNKETFNFQTILNSSSFNEELRADISEKCETTFRNLTATLCSPPKNSVPSNYDQVRNILKNQYLDSQPSSAQNIKDSLFIHKQCVDSKDTNRPNSFDSLMEKINSPLPTQIRQARSFEEALQKDYQHTNLRTEDLICDYMPKPYNLKKLDAAIAKECGDDTNLANIHCQYLKATRVVLAPSENDVVQMRKLAALEVSKEGIQGEQLIQEAIAKKVEKKTQDFIKKRASNNSEESTALVDYFVNGKKAQSQVAKQVHSKQNAISQSASYKASTTFDMAKSSALNSRHGSPEQQFTEHKKTLTPTQESIKSNMSNFYDEINRRIKLSDAKRAKTPAAKIANYQHSSQIPTEYSQALTPPASRFDDEEYDENQFNQSSQIVQAGIDYDSNPDQAKLSDHNSFIASTGTDPSQRERINKQINSALLAANTARNATGSSKPSGVLASPLSTESIEKLSSGKLARGEEVVLDLDGDLTNFIDQLISGEIKDSPTVLGHLKKLIQTQNVFYIKPTGKDFKFKIEKVGNQFKITQTLGNQINSLKIAEMITQFLKKENLNQLLASKKSAYENFRTSI